jgi:hypothetical protein
MISEKFEDLTHKHEKLSTELVGEVKEIKALFTA